MKNQVLIPAFNVAYLPMVEAIMEALDERPRPLLFRGFSS